MQSKHRTLLRVEKLKVLCQLNYTHALATTVLVSLYINLCMNLEPLKNGIIGVVFL